MLEKSLARKLPTPAQEYLRNEIPELERKNLQIKLAPSVVEEIKENPFLQTALSDIYEFDDRLSKKRATGYNFDTYRHSLRTANLISAAAPELKLKPATTRLLIQAAIIHDVGKIRMSPELMAKKGGLSTEEKSVHVTEGLNYLKEKETDASVLPSQTSDKLKYIIGRHHEKDNYPRANRTDRRSGVIPLWGKRPPSKDRRKNVDPDTEKAGHLFQIFDKFEALSGRRSYKKIWDNTEIQEALFKVYPDQEDQDKIKLLLEKISG